MPSRPRLLSSLLLPPLMGARMATPVCARGHGQYLQEEVELQFCICSIEQWACGYVVRWLS